VSFNLTGTYNIFGGGGGDNRTPPAPVTMHNHQQRQQARQDAGSVYATPLALNSLQQQQLQQQMGLTNTGYGYQRDELGLRNQQQNALLGADQGYLNQQVGFANRGHDLTRQMLGWDHGSLGIRGRGYDLDDRSLDIDDKRIDVNRNEYNRAWGDRRFDQRSDFTQRGAFTSNAHRFKDKSLNEQLWYAMQGFGLDKDKIGIERQRVGLNRDELGMDYGRLGTRHGQNDLGRDETLARLMNQMNANNIQGSYGNRLHQNSLNQLGHDQALNNNTSWFDMQRALQEQYGLNSQQAALFGQLFAGYQQMNPYQGPTSRQGGSGSSLEQMYRDLLGG
jgi:hypothetical protein